MRAILSALLAAGLAIRAAAQSVLFVEGLQGQEYNEATGTLGYTTTVVTTDEFAAMTTDEFAAYNAIIIGDPGCGDLSQIQFLNDTKATWSAAVGGYIILIGTDPTVHYEDNPGALTLIDDGIAFVASGALTGLYLSLSCYYNDEPDPTTVESLTEFGTFLAYGAGGCYEEAHVVASAPATSGLTDDDLSNWGCSVHEVFSSYPTTGSFGFSALVIAEDATGAGTQTFADGTTGIPYIIARGVTPAGCGNGIYQPEFGEECDEGESNGDEGVTCSDSCQCIYGVADSTTGTCNAAPDTTSVVISTTESAVVVVPTTSGASIGVVTITTVVPTVVPTVVTREAGLAVTTVPIDQDAAVQEFTVTALVTTVVTTRYPIATSNGQVLYATGLATEVVASVSTGSSTALLAAQEGATAAANPNNPTHAAASATPLNPADPNDPNNPNYNPAASAAAGVNVTDPNDPLSSLIDAALGYLAGIENIVITEKVVRCSNGVCTTETIPISTLCRPIYATANSDYPCYPCLFGTPAPTDFMTVITSLCPSSANPTPTFTVQGCASCAQTTITTDSVPGYNPTGTVCNGCGPITPAPIAPATAPAEASCTSLTTVTAQQPNATAPGAPIWTGATAGAAPAWTLVPSGLAMGLVVAAAILF